MSRRPWWSIRWSLGLDDPVHCGGCRLVGALYLNPFFLQGFSLADRSWRGAAGLGDLTRSALLVVSRLPSLCRRLAAHAVEEDNSTEDGNAPRAMLRLRGRLNLCCAVDCGWRWPGVYGHPGKQLTITTYGSLPVPLTGGSPTRQREWSPGGGSFVPQ